MCKQINYYITADFLQNTYHDVFQTYQGDPENADWQALLEIFISKVRDGDYNAELKDAALIPLDSHTIFPSIHGWRFILYSYAGLKAKPQAIIVIDD